MWSVSIRGGAPQKIGTGHTPTVAPSGSHLAFLRDGGDRLAFVSDRGDHSFVGVYDLDAHRLRYLSSGVDHDSNPV